MSPADFLPTICSHLLAKVGSFGLSPNDPLVTPTVERTYDTSWFHDQVAWFPAEDHNVPQLHMLHQLAVSADAWLKTYPADGVFAIHCKGGKGRTGTAVCAHLIFTHKMLPDQALAKFENDRTDTDGLADGNSQGVGGKSQIRYVHYYAQILKEERAGLGSLAALYRPPQVGRRSRCVFSSCGVEPLSPSQLTDR